MLFCKWGNLLELDTNQNILMTKYSNCTSPVSSSTGYFYTNLFDSLDKIGMKTLKTLRNRKDLALSRLRLVVLLPDSFCTGIQTSTYTPTSALGTHVF